MTTNLETIYDALTVLYAEFDGIASLSVKFTEMGITIQAVFHCESKDINNQALTCSYVVSKMEMEQLKNFVELEKHILNQIRDAHMVWEVGEQ